MFSSNIKSFIILNIYLLVFVNILLVFSIYYQIVKEKIRTKRYKSEYKVLSQIINEFINGREGQYEVEKLLNSDLSKNVAIDIMTDYAQKNEVDISQKYMQLKLDDYLIVKLRANLDITYLKKLAFIGVETAYDLLMKFADSKDLDICYTSFFALSNIKLTDEKKEIVINKLVKSDIITDRIIEILNKFDLDMDVWLELLEKEESQKGKVIHLMNVGAKADISKEEYSDMIVGYLKDEFEIRIATIFAICRSGNEKYLNELGNIYKNEEEWKVRAAIAKGLGNFEFEKVREILIAMTKDDEWWVRYDSIKSIVAMGEDGLFTIIDLSLDSKDKNISNLAYYFLNSNKDVYDTVKNIEG
jgi:hypothetical protein